MDQRPGYGRGRRHYTGDRDRAHRQLRRDASTTKLRRSMFRFVKHPSVLDPLRGTPRPGPPLSMPGQADPPVRRLGEVERGQFAVALTRGQHRVHPDAGRQQPCRRAGLRDRAWPPSRQVRAPSRHGPHFSKVAAVNPVGTYSFP